MMAMADIPPMLRTAFITVGAEYVDDRLIPELLARRHSVRTLAREGPEHKVPPGCSLVRGNALDPSAFADHIRSADTFLHLVCVSHPSPANADEFRKIDYAPTRGAFAAARSSGIRRLEH